MRDKLSSAASDLEIPAVIPSEARNLHVPVLEVQIPR
jgi:hypothetical protein